ncbi:NmrA domain-containing protein [Favolaschia claudopus]|uniref:NmrA domain-containing protein n=1 Tax=Favolaschia claudopus TaxID=2862362 RepID=A0AAW0EIC1_9AGAR
MSSSRIVAVIGATGQQGLSVIRKVLKDKTFTPRALTRDPSSATSKHIQEQGAEVVKADTRDKASLVDALRGSEALFVVTLSGYPPYSADKPSEITIGKNIVDAAKEAGVKFIVLSSGPGLTKLTGGKYSKVTFYDDKAQVEEYLKVSGILNASLHLGTFTENMWTQGTLKKNETGALTFSVPCFKATEINGFTWVGHDVGEATLALLKNYETKSDDISGRAYPVVTANISHGEFAAIISKVLGKEVTFITAPPTGHPNYDQMFQAAAEYQGFYFSTPVPNPELAGLGAKFGTIEEFVQTEIKKRFSD